MKIFWAGIFCLVVLGSNSTQATTIQINNLDAVGTGLNDATPATPVGGNPGITLGEQRRYLFEHALTLWASVIKSNQTIYADASFTPLTCTSNSAVLGSASPNTVHINFSGRPFANTIYVQAQANSLANTDLNSMADLTLRFNSSLDSDPNCLVGQEWYYGLDGQTPAGKIDLLAVVMHELAHGLGFSTFVDLLTGAKFSGFDDAYMTQLEDHSLNKTWPNLTDAQRVASAIDVNDLHWKGAATNTAAIQLSSGINQGHLMMYAPGVLKQGSSVAHVTDAVAPDDLMEPFHTGSKNTLGLAPQALKDMGWNLYASAAPVIGPLLNQTIFDSETVTIFFVVKDNDTNLNNLIFTLTSSDATVVSQNNLSISGAGTLRSIAITPNQTGTTTITLSVFDGTQTSQRIFLVTVIQNQAPTINLIAPINNANSFVNSIHFSATANDAEDGNLSNQIQWYSSVDGYLGQGTILDHNLSDATHQITAKVTDIHQKLSQTTVTLSVNANGDNDGDGLSNSFEISIGSNPNNSDSDGDGIPDGTDPQPLIPNAKNTQVPASTNGLLALFALVIGLVVSIRLKRKFQ